MDGADEPFCRFEPLPMKSFASVDTPFFLRFDISSL